MKICSRRENSRADKNNYYNSEEPLSKPRPERARFFIWL